MRTLIIIATVVLIVACAHDSANDWIRLTSNPDVVRGCKYLGQVEDSDHSLWGSGHANENVEESIRAQAADKGANVIFLNTATATQGWLANGGSAQKQGDAYRCDDGPTPPSQAK